ncbi:hypothetical protein PR003_g8935 [Phytophthora rubi]|uniref:Uncharacterized protein n=1 Tax=Phytophthora rubi TaxID=129364 RepID=A0A6A4FFQ5_9STRA|nr:hypothetical protein PR003_g8935 [Phytophthora rubi]
MVNWMLQTAVPLSEADLQYPRESRDSLAAKNEPGKVLDKLRLVVAESEIDKTALVDFRSSDVV